jgi:hypothetical protein
MLSLRDICSLKARFHFGYSVKMNIPEHVFYVKLLVTDLL